MLDPIAAVQSAFPGRRVALEGSGQLSTAVRVDNDLVVRVPKHAYGIDRLRFEVELLRSIGDRLTAATPEIVKVALDLPVGEAFVAHRRMNGEILRRSDTEELKPSELEHIGRQIGRFLTEFHAIDLKLVPNVPVLTPAQFARQLADEVVERLGPRLSKERVDDLLATLTGLDTLPSSPIVLTHSDLGGNVVVDESGSVGFIDFGSCFATHPAFDVASLTVLGEPLVRAVAAEYPLLATMTSESAAVTRTFALQDALYGARQEAWDYVSATLDDLG